MEKNNDEDLLGVFDGSPALANADLERGDFHLKKKDDWHSGRRSPGVSAISFTGSPSNKSVQFEIGGGEDEDSTSDQSRMMELGGGDLGRSSRAETIDYFAQPTSVIPLLPAIAEEKLTTIVINPSFSQEPSSKAEIEKEVVYGFVELHVLSGEGEVGTKEWKQTARWIKYEEDLEEGSQRWGKPHVATLSFHSLFKLKQLIERDGLVMMNMEEIDMPGIAYRVADELVSKSLIRAEDSPLLMRMLLLKHKHVEETEGGWFRLKRNNTSAMNLQNYLEEKNRNRSITDTTGLVRRNSSVSKGTAELGTSSRSLHRTSSGNYLRSTVNGVDNNQVSVEIKGINETTYHPSEEDLKWIQGKENLIRRLPQGAEGTLVLVGQFELIRRPVFIFVRLKEASFIFNVSEIPVPMRFLTIILNPPTFEMDLLEVGRAFGTLMSNKDFFEVAMSGVSRKSLLVGINEFLDESIVLPPGDWNNRDLLPLHVLQTKSKAIRKRRIKKQLSNVQTLVDLQISPAELNNQKTTEKQLYDPMHKTGCPFGGVWQDIRKRYPRYCSDIRDGLNWQCFATTVFIYCASIAQVITFAGLIGEKTGGLIGMSETLVATAGAGMLFSLFAGQPLIPLGPTGPLLVFDEILFQSCARLEIEFLPIRFWISLWLLVIVIVVLSFEATVLSKWFTRFTQDIFAVLTSVLLIFESAANLIAIYVQHPLGSANLDIRPIALTINTTHYSILYEETTSSPFMDESEDLRRQPNTALLSTILMLGTFFIAYFLREFRNSVFLGERARRALGDFGVPIAVITMVILDYCATDTYTRKMKVPNGFHPSDPDQRGWVVDILGRDKDFDSRYILIAILPAMLLFILIFMTTQICELIVNKEEKKMVKGGGIHLDIFIIAIVNVVCGILGAPWLCCATLRALAHVTALTVYSQNNPPGEKPTIVEVKEQRLSNFTLSVLIGCTVLLAPILQFIPLAVLFGVFLYMGVSSLSSTQLFDRFSLLFIPAKQHPPTIYVRRVRTWKMHLYTLIQLACLVCLWAVKSVKDMALAFPFVLMFLVPIRIHLKHIFEDIELEVLDGDRPK